MNKQKFAICLWPYHPECAQSHLTSEANQGPTWLELGWEMCVIYAPKPFFCPILFSFFSPS